MPDTNLRTSLLWALILVDMFTYLLHVSILVGAERERERETP